MQKEQQAIHTKGNDSNLVTREINISKALRLNKTRRISHESELH